MRQTVTAGVVALVLATTACSGEAPRGEPALGPTVPVRSPADLVLPLDRYEPTAEQQRVQAQAHRLLVRECARRFGFEVPAVSPAETTAPIGHERLYGIITIEDATRFGYRPPVDVLTRQAAKSAKAEASARPDGWQPSDEEFVAVRGVDRYTGEPRTGTAIKGVPVPRGGCAGEAGRQLDRDVPTSAVPLADLPGKLALEAHRSAEADSRVRSGFAAWASCMKRAGYTYRSPWEPNDRSWGERITAEEKATAKADVQCRRETGLLDVWLAVEKAYQDRLIADNDDKLADVAKALEVRSRNAAAVLGR